MSAERSTSRGRDIFVRSSHCSPSISHSLSYYQLSSGRGGIGNIRPASKSRDERPSSGPDDFSATRGREPIAKHDQVQQMHFENPT